MTSLSPARHDREIGEVVAVTSIRVVVEIHEDLSSPIHSYPGGQSTIAQIGAYLSFPIGAGEAVVGVIVGAFQHEGYEPDPHGGMTLQLAKPRRTLQANLLGTLGSDQKFRHGVAVYPTLGSPALVPGARELGAILDASTRSASVKAVPLELGTSPIYETVHVKASLDDLFSRPLALVGNTGSGKSWSVASSIQRCLTALQPQSEYCPKFIILDINGEYGQAFKKPDVKRLPNTVYIDSIESSLPLWMFQLGELVALCGASIATQVPVLERMITSARETALVMNRNPGERDTALEMLSELRQLDLVLEATRVLRELTYVVNGEFVGQKTKEHFSQVSGFLQDVPPRTNDIISTRDDLNLAEVSVLSQQQCLLRITGWGNFDNRYMLPETVREALRKMCSELEPIAMAVRATLEASLGLPEVTADMPFPFDPFEFGRSGLVERAIAGLGSEGRLQEYLATLRLRIRRLLGDRRWQAFRSKWERSLYDVVSAVLGVSEEETSVVVIDCSMLSYDVLPFFCAVVGRVLLDLREHADPSQRTCSPWVLVLEEAHNYLRPRREGEDAGLTLSREAFERIAKEGRKFGMSLIIASQRPSDVSETVLSQCANFIVHRIQNPDDIEYFKRILPGGSREMLDQVSILTPGEALLLGSAVNVPCRVRVWEPNPAPRSETPQPSQGWRRENAERFKVETAISNWTHESEQPTETSALSPEN